MDIPFGSNQNPIPQGDPTGQAVASLKGYAYQLYASALAWLSLQNDEELYLEVAQDYAIAAKEAMAAVQVKDMRANVTINSPHIRQAISEFVDLVDRNPGRRVVLRFLTTSNIGTEQRMEDRAAGEPTLQYWTSAASGADIGPLRMVLERLDLSDAAKAYIKERQDEQLRRDLLCRIFWDCGAPDYLQIKDKLADLVVTFANEHLRVPPSEANRATAAILQHILEKAIQPTPLDRKLSRAALLELVEKATHISIPRAGLETYVKAVVSGELASNRSTILERTPCPQLDIMKDALERDYSARYRQAQQRSFFPELQEHNQFESLAQEILDGNLGVISEELRRRIFLRASRTAAVNADLAAAQRYLDAAIILTGSDVDLPARARLAEARGEIDAAIQILRDEVDPDSRATLLSIVAKARGDHAAFTLIENQNINVHDLTVNGIYTVCSLYLANKDYEKVRGISEGISERHIEECPYFLLLRGVVRFASILAKPDQQLAFMGKQIDIRHVRPIATDSQTRVILDGAIHDMRCLTSILKELRLPETIKIVEDYILWFELLHPTHCETALTRLAADMQNPTTALKRISFALAYLPNFDAAPILTHLENRAMFGGLNDDELRASFAILMDDSKDKARLSAFITQQRRRLEQMFGKNQLCLIEIQALAHAGNTTAARVLLDANRSEIQPDELVHLNAILATAEGGDPVAEFRLAYVKTQTVDALWNLIAALSQCGDHRSIGPYAEELFEKTNDPMHLSIAARSYAKAGESDHFMRIVQGNNAMLDRNSDFRRYYAWQLFDRGRLAEALVQAERLAEESATRDLDLEIAIAIESGEWDTLAQPLVAYLQTAPNHPAIALIKAAHLSQAAGQGPLKGLVSAALAKGSDDPNVLIGAYMVYVEEGLDSNKDDAQQWFKRALELSGPDGPIQQFELKDIIEKHTEWTEQARRIQEGIMRGDIPLIVGSLGLRTTLADIVLRNFTRNAALADARRKVAIPLFSGRRAPEAFGAVKRVALDFSTLLVLGWLGVLPKVFDTFNEIVLPNGIFRDLFEGRRRIREFQKSRLRRAERIQQAIASGKVKVVRPSLSRHDPLVTEVGDELAGLLRVGESANGIVLRPAPVRKPGMLNQDADVSPYAQRLADMHSLLSVLQDNGLTDNCMEESAKRYFELQDKGWPSPARPNLNQPLYIEGLGLIYLDSIGLLDIVIDAFSQVFIHSNTADEAAGIVEYDNQTTEVLQVIDRIRESIRKAQSNGNVVYGPKRPRNPNGNGNDDEVFNPSTLNLLSNLEQAEVVGLDDRGLNKEPFVLDSFHHQARVVTTLDVIEELSRRRVISDDERRTLRHRLRVAGASLVPLDTEEVVIAALRRRGSDSAELRAMKESILLARVAALPRFPSEIPWLATTMIAIKNAIMEIWVKEQDHERAAVLAEVIRDLQTNPEDWVDQWDGQTPPNWVNVVRVSLLAGLALPMELQESELTHAYNSWLERNILGPLRYRDTQSYTEVVELVRSSIDSVVEDKEDIEKDIVVPKRTLAIFVLNKLSDKLQSDILSDPKAATSWDISTTRTMPLTVGLKVQWENLFSIFRAATDGVPIPSLRDERNNEHAIHVSIDSQGGGLLEIGQQRLAFQHAVLMSSSPQRRVTELERIFASAVIHSALQDEMRHIVSDSNFEVEQFMKIARALASAPDEFQARLSEKASMGRIAINDIFPEDYRYWDNLTAPIGVSNTLADFIAGELASERSARVARDSIFGFRSIALTFSAPALVPYDLLEVLEKDSKSRILEDALVLDDHFSLIGAFELCANWIRHNPDFADVGERLLDRLFGDISRLETACGMFGAAFILSVANISKNDKLNARPAFWRRLAAASHAQLVVRACGVTSIDPMELIEWSLQQYGQAYFLSVLCDFRTDPRWRSEWVEPHFLLADVCGRAFVACSKIPDEKIPASWSESIARLRKWIEEKNYELLTMFPAVMEGERRSILPTVREMQDVAKLYDAFIREPSVDQLLTITPAIHVFGPPREIIESLHKIVSIIRTDSLGDEEGALTIAIKLLSHTAVLLQDVKLANAVAEVCIERLAVDQQRATVVEVLYRLLECAAAETDKVAWRLFLSRKLDQVGYMITNRELLAEVVTWIEKLKLINPELNCGLGRALSIAKLGASGSTAAHGG